jgi:hypothetical protein
MMNETLRMDDVQSNVGPSHERSESDHVLASLQAKVDTVLAGPFVRTFEINLAERGITTMGAMRELCGITARTVPTNGLDKEVYSRVESPSMFKAAA